MTPYFQLTNPISFLQKQQQQTNKTCKTCLNGSKNRENSDLLIRNRFLDPVCKKMNFKGSHMKTF